MSSKFTFGSDPEFVITDGKSVKSAIDVVPGSKKKKHKVGDFCFYYDNVLAECTIPPSTTREEAIDTFRVCLKTYANLVKPYRLSATAWADYPKSELTHPAAMEVGCKREACAYTLTQPEPPQGIFETSGARSAGGHIHIGHKVAKDSFGCLAVIRMLDLFMGIPSVLMDHDPTSKNRKELYGKAGRFRQPKHGAEYRTPSNFWIQTPELVGLMFDIGKFTAEFVAKKKHDELWFIDFEKLDDDASWANPDFNPASCHICKGYDVAQLRDAIDAMDKTKATTFLPIISKYLPGDLMDKIAKLSVPFEIDLYDAWGLE